MKVEKFGFYKTKGGCPVRILTTTANSDHPVQGEVLIEGRWVKMQWISEGKRHYFGKPSINDLVEVSNPFELVEPENSGPLIELCCNYETIEKLPVLIYKVDCGGSHPVHGAIFQGGRWKMMEWTCDGNKNLSQSSKFDLREVHNHFQAAVDKANDFINSISISPTQNRTG